MSGKIIPADNVTIFNPKKSLIFLGLFSLHQSQKKYMEITNDFKNEILTNSKTIEKIEVLYKKKEKFSGKLSIVKDEPFEITIYDKDKDESEAEHFIYFGRAVEIALYYDDGTINVFKDIID